MPHRPVRRPLIDALKGLACIAIVWHHLAFYGPMSDVARPLMPQLVDVLYDYGRMAVQVFLVVAGFLAAASLAPQGVPRFRSAGQQIGRRLVRLVVPYAAALGLALAASALVRPWLSDDSVPAAPTLPQLAAHLVLLQDLVDEEALSAGVWYVAIDFQLFVLATVLFALVGRLHGAAPRRARCAAQAMVAAFTAASLLYFNRRPGLDVTAAYFFGAYGLGMFAFWGAQGRSGRMALALALLGGAALALDFRARIAVAVATALLLCLAAGPRPKGGDAMPAWRRMPAPLLALGRMSYSVFLVHFPVCLLVNAAVHWFWPVQPWINAVGMVLAFALSLLAGWVLYRRVESRTASWETTLRHALGMPDAGRRLPARAKAVFARAAFRFRRLQRSWLSGASMVPADLAAPRSADPSGLPQPSRPAPLAPREGVDILY